MEKNGPIQLQVKKVSLSPYETEKRSDYCCNEQSTCQGKASNNVRELGRAMVS